MKREELNLNKTFVSTEDRHINVEEFEDNYAKINERVRNDLKFFGKLRLYSPNKLQNFMHKIKELRSKGTQIKKLNILDICKSAKFNFEKQNLSAKTVLNNIQDSRKSERIEFPAFTQRSNSHSYPNDTTPRYAYSRKANVLKRNKIQGSNKISIISPRESHLNFSIIQNFNDSEEKIENVYSVNTKFDPVMNEPKENRKKLIFRLLRQTNS